MQADSPRLSPGAGVAVLVFLQQRSVPGAGSCRGSERAGPPPEHRPHAQHRSSQPSLHQGCRRGPGHPLCRLAPTTREEAGWGAGRQVERVGEAVTPPLSRWSLPTTSAHCGYRSTLRLCPWTPLSAAWKFQSPLSGLQVEVATLGPLRGLLTQQGCLAGAWQCEVGQEESLFGGTPGDSPTWGSHLN